MAGRGCRRGAELGQEGGQTGDYEGGVDNQLRSEGLHDGLPGEERDAGSGIGYGQEHGVAQGGRKPSHHGGEQISRPQQKDEAQEYRPGPLYAEGQGQRLLADEPVRLKVPEITKQGADKYQAEDRNESCKRGEGSQGPLLGVHQRLHQQLPQ